MEAVFDIMPESAASAVISAPSHRLDWVRRGLVSSHVADGLRATWETFFRTGNLDALMLRPEIAASWQQCRKQGIDPCAPKAPVKMNQRQLAQAREESKAFIEAALPFLKFLERVIGSGFILVLTDRSGIVLEVFGDAALLAMACANNYVAGCSRADAEVGTNAIGLALCARKPMQLTGAEHYNVRHHHWTCACAPVFSPRGDLLGSVTLSGESTNSHRHTLGMVVSASEAIQEHLRGREANLRHSRSYAVLSSVLGSILDAVVTIDEAGAITHVNAAAARLLSARPAQWIGKSIVRLFPSNPEIIRILDNGRENGAQEVVIGAGDAVYTMTPYVIHHDGAMQGAILTLREKSEAPKPVSDLSGFKAAFRFEDIIGGSPPLMRQIELARITARQNARILIVGETGTGKELFAQAIHNSSPRCDGPFVAINCAAIPRELLESELFGYKGGAFTGARKGGQIGKLELADGGTLFLDEISQMPLDLQAKLLRVLQDGRVTRLGDAKPISVNARIIAAANEDLYQKSCGGGFRQDLYFRLSVVELTLPPLRERREDIPQLSRSILARMIGRFEKGNPTLSEAALDVLCSYQWPGNIRELENVLEMAAIVCDGGVIEPAQLAHRLKTTMAPLPVPCATTLAVQPMRELEIELIRATLKEFNGNIATVARRLSISRSTIYRRMKENSIMRKVNVD